MRSLQSLAAAAAAAAVFASSIPGSAAGALVEVTAFGARGDGTALDTAAIQAAIDRCAEQGPGEVRVPPGRYRTGSLQLRSGVRFHLVKGAILLGSTSLDDYRRGPLLSAEDAQGIAIEGEGEIDASGEAFWEKADTYTGPAWRGTAQFEYRALRRPRCLHFLRCRDLSLRGITIRNSPSWTIHLQRCAGVKVERVTIRNPLHGPNTDGIDINSCRDVLVDSCDIVTGDDGVVLKSTEPGRDHPSSGITVSRCRIMSACNALKIGTETHSDFERIVFRDCELHSSSSRPLDRALSGVAIESVDGSNLRDIRVENIRMTNLRAPLFVRLGHRGGNSEKTRQVEPRVPGTIRDVVFRNIKAERMMFESSITGIPGHAVEGVVLEDVALSYEGGGGPELVDAEAPDREVIGKYPEAQMFGRLPAYGLFARHVSGLSLRNVSFSLEKPDARPAIVLDHVGGSRLESVRADAPDGGEPLFAFTRIRDAEIRGCAAPAGKLLLRVLGEPGMRQELRFEGGPAPVEGKDVLFQTPLEALGSLPLFRENETAPGIIEIPAARMKLTPPMCAGRAPGEPSGGAIGVPLDGGRDSGKARARFEVREAGTYVVVVHVLAPSGESNSFYLRIDEAPPHLTDVRSQPEWAWDFIRDRVKGEPDPRSRSEFALAPGIHVVTLANREPGTWFRALAIVRADRLAAAEKAGRFR